RLARGDDKALALADRVIDDPVMLAEHPAIEMNDLTLGQRLRVHLFDDVDILALRDKADVLAVVLFGDFEVEFTRQFTHGRLAHPAQRKAQEIELILRRRKEEV